ncbi:MAG: pilus assembly protein PilP [Myxococcales bacterium]|nr:pilus assembly protein PilP [Myxococcales bacterium]MCB9646869.1 pilus assembly protein PilP [Deltaproteobacteria bacterium]
MERTTITRFALLGLLAVGLWACEDAPPPPKPATPGNAATGLKVLTGGGDPTTGAPATPTGAAPAGGAAAPAAPTEGGEEDVNEIAYAYSPIGKRDPFRSLFDQLQRDDATQQLTELQKFELDQLRLVAIVSRIATPYAMVEDPSGKGHTLTRGTLIGKNWGRVAQIDPECVVIKEEYRDYTGRKVTNKTSMCLPKPSDLKLD